MEKDFIDIRWKNLEQLNSKNFTCWNCGKNIVSNIGYKSIFNNSGYETNAKVYICHYCGAPNIFDKSNNPAVINIAGKEIRKLPENIKNVYNEARACMSVEAYTGAVMLFRKILMSIAVSEGDKEGKKFTEYVKYLCDNGLVHRKQTKQADEVRKLGNTANHELENRSKDEAEKIFKFVEFLLLNNFEFADENEEENAK